MGEINQKLCDLIRKAQGERSQNLYASQCEVSSAAITKIFKGTYAPSAKTLKKLATKAHNGVTYQMLFEAAGYLETAQPRPRYKPTFRTGTRMGYAGTRVGYAETSLRKASNAFLKEVERAEKKDATSEDATRFQFERFYNRIERVITYPVLGTVRAGFNGAIDEIPTGEEIEIPSSMINKEEKNDYFVLQIKGNSMYPKLIDGDKILCKRQNDVDCGSLAVVLYDGEEATVKKVNYDVGRNWIDLIPFNPEYAPKRIEGADLQQCRILGKVLKLIRDL